MADLKTTDLEECLHCDFDLPFTAWNYWPNDKASCPHCRAVLTPVALDVEYPDGSWGYGTPYFWCEYQTVETSGEYEIRTRPLGPSDLVLAWTAPALSSPSFTYQVERVKRDD